MVIINIFKQIAVFMYFPHSISKFLLQLMLLIES